MQPVVFSPSADVFVVRPLRKNSVLSQRPHVKDICRGGEYHRLHVQFRPPDDGPVRPETCRGKRIADIVRRQNLPQSTPDTQSLSSLSSTSSSHTVSSSDPFKALLMQHFLKDLTIVLSGMAFHAANTHRATSEGAARLIFPVSVNLAVYDSLLDFWRLSSITTVHDKLE